MEMYGSLVAIDDFADCFTPSSVIFNTKNISSFLTKMLYSGILLVGCCKWQVLVSLGGHSADHLSIFLDVQDPDSLPDGWSRYAPCLFTVVNQVYPQNTVAEVMQCTFNAQASRWGFPSFMPLSDLRDPSKGFLVDDTLIVIVFLAVHYDSKRETGYVGLENQGTTSYMNSLLQTLYHIPYFRKAVYHMPTVDNDIPSRSIHLALKSLFYELQYSKSSVATTELSESLEWDTRGVQDLNRALFENLEDKMKGTADEGIIQQLFEGHHMNYIECINVNNGLMRKESFYDIQLDVRGCKDVYASFDKYVGVEHLGGDNQYHTELHGLQDAGKGVLFIDFPSVLQLQLKRFEYDFVRDTMEKINDRYEFPLELDLDRKDRKYLTSYADKRVRNLFTLHSVLVHSGGEHGGHYHALIRPTLSNQWLKFDDERVTKEDIKSALEEQYSGEEELPLMSPGFNNTPSTHTRYSYTYMLIYIRNSDMEKVFCNVDGQDIVEHLRTRLKKELEEKEHNKSEAHLYTIIKVVRNEDLAKQIGKSVYFDLVNHDKVRCFRIKKQMPFCSFKDEVEKEFGIPVQFQRFWLWRKRPNGTYRPDQPLTPQEETKNVGHLREISNIAHNAVLNLFLEVELGLDLHPIQPPEKTKEDIMVFFKLYDPIQEELRYIGRLFVKTSGCPSEILTKLNGMAGFSSSQEIKLYEEMKFKPSVMCKPIQKELTFQANQLKDGDIVCFQKSPPVGSGQQCRFPNVPSFLEYVHNRQVVRFRSLKKPKEDEFCLELSKRSIYAEIVKRVALQLGVHDPLKIRVTPHKYYFKQHQPIRRKDCLSDMLAQFSQKTCDILYFEVLDAPLCNEEDSSASPQWGRPSVCAICLDAPLEAACYPCYHMVACMSCLDKIKRKNLGCPVCRAKIQQVLKIFPA